MRSSGYPGDEFPALRQVLATVQSEESSGEFDFELNWQSPDSSMLWPRR
jgi:hypothetical protein